MSEPSADAEVAAERLGPFGFGPVPPKPRGFTREQRGWALANADRSREALLILGILGALKGFPADPAARRMAR